MLCYWQKLIIVMLLTFTVMILIISVVMILFFFIFEKVSNYNSTLVISHKKIKTDTVIFFFTNVNTEIFVKFEVFREISYKK